MEVSGVRRTPALDNLANMLQTHAAMSTNRFRRTYGVTPAVFRLAAVESKNLQD